MSDSDENHLIGERRAKLAKLRERGIAFPNDFRRNALAADLLTAYGEKSGEAARCGQIRVSVAGRMRAKRVHGQGEFHQARGFEPARSKLFLQQGALGEAYDEFKGWDVGDIVGRRRRLVPYQDEMSCRCARSASCS